MNALPKKDTYKEDLLGELVQSRAYGVESVANLRIGDQYERDFLVKHCTTCGFDWSPVQSDKKGIRKCFKYKKGWGFGLRLDKKVCPDCQYIQVV